VVEVQHEPVEVDLLLAVPVVVVHLTVAADAGTLGPARGHRGPAGTSLLDHVPGHLDFLIGFLDPGVGAVELSLQFLDLALLGLDDAPHLFRTRRLRRRGANGKTRNDQPGRQSLKFPVHRCLPLETCYLTETSFLWGDSMNC
jgi:hypothetical protein